MGSMGHFPRDDALPEEECIMCGPIVSICTQCMHTGRLFCAMLSSRNTRGSYRGHPNLYSKRCVPLALRGDLRPLGRRSPGEERLVALTCTTHWAFIFGGTYQTALWTTHRC